MPLMKSRPLKKVTGLVLTLAALLNAPALSTAQVSSPPSPPTGGIVFVSTRDGNEEIYTANDDGSNATNLSNHPARDNAPDWSPDGTKIVFASNRGGQSEVWVMNADGSNAHPLTSNNSEAKHLQWSPDGRRIVWQNYDGNQHDICVVNADGTGFINLTQDSVYQDRPQWSPDSSKVAYEDYSWGFAKILLIGRNGTGIYNVTDSRPQDSEGTADYRPSWSPDGQFIATRRRYSSVPDNGIWGILIPSCCNRWNQTADDTDTSPSWSPDNQRIAYLRNIGGLYQLFDIERFAFANEAKQITSGLNIYDYYRPQWSPGSRRLAFTVGTDGSREIYTVNANGTRLFNLSRNGADDFDVKWHPLTPEPPEEEDQDAPSTTASLSAPPNGSGWHKADVTVILTASDEDGGSGVESITYSASGAQVTPETTINGNAAMITVVGEGTTTISYHARDAAGNVEIPKTVTVKLDKTAPVIHITSPSAYTVGQVAVADFNCGDAVSGVTACAGTVADGATLDTSSIGAKTFEVNATDEAGNASQKSVGYTVGYGVSPQYDQTKAHKSGSTIPIKLQLTDVGGLNLSSAGLVVTASGTIRVSTNTSGELADAGASNPDFNFRYSGGGYIFNLKTTGYAPGTYLLLFRAGSDPTDHTVEFRIRQ
jgi:Tol biopolymer transport system component